MFGSIGYAKRLAVRLRAIVLLGTVAIAIPFIIAFAAPPKEAGIAVSLRFMERPGGIPAESKSPAIELSATSLSNWVASTENVRHIGLYAFRVIPLDLLYIFALGGFLAASAWLLAKECLAAGNPLAAVHPALWLIAPGLYVVADTAEDVLIYFLLVKPDAITEVTVGVLAALRSTKISASAAAMLQVFVLGLLGAMPMDRRRTT